MSLPSSDQRGTLIALEPRIRAAFHPLYHEIARRRDLSAGAKVVYAVLCSYHQMFSDVFPGRERLATDTGLSAHQLVDATRSLVDASLLHVKRRGFGQTNVYTLLRWPGSTDIPRGTTVIPDGISGDAETESLPIEEKEREQEAGLFLQEEQDPAALWTRTLATLRDQYRVSAGNVSLLNSLEVRFDHGTLVVRCSRDLAERWGGYLRKAAEVPVRFEVG